jgi:hypothetical protein
MMACGGKTAVAAFLKAVKPALEDVSVGIFWLSPLPRRNQIEAFIFFKEFTSDSKLGV